MNVFQAVDNFNSVANVFRKRTDADDDQGDQKAMLGNNNQQQLMEQIQGLASGKEEMPKVAAHKEAKVVEEPIHKRYFTEILCVVLFRQKFYSKCTVSENWILHSRAAPKKTEKVKGQ
ncbi:hypothetical protein TYRP_019971 [Tyrophagus putrescentiae]|nr:hypothetical protein TYRP_019971 [Tyrophagus putrescentiae]